MKKLIVSMMLIIGMFAFAAESDPSATVGYVKYSNVTTAGSNLNLVGYPVGDYAMAGDFDPTGTNLGSVSKWDAASQSWTGTSYNALFGSWISNYAVVKGQSYMVDVKAGMDYDMIFDGEVEAIPAYSLITTTGSNLNLIMHPLDKANLTMAGAGIGNDIGTANIGTVSRWNAATQTWAGTSYNALFGSWLSDFATEIANPLMLDMKAAYTWPNGKLESVIDENYVKSAPKGLPKDIYWAVTDHLGQEYDFSAGQDGVTCRAWMEARPDEMGSPSGALDYAAGFVLAFNYVAMPGYSIVQFNAGNFPTAWGTDDVLRTRCSRTVATKDGKTVWYEGTSEGILLNIGDTSAIFGGCGDATYVNPIVIDESTPSSIEGNLPTVTTLHQNYPNPFNPTTTIKFDLASNSNVKLNVYNYNGQLVKSLVNGQMNAGYHTVNFDAANLSAGVYYYTMEAAGKTMTQKMVLVK